MSPVTCRLSCVTCHLSDVKIYIHIFSSLNFLLLFLFLFLFLFSSKNFDKVVELGGGGSVINGAYPV